MSLGPYAPLVGADRAAAAAGEVLASFRQAGDAVVHVQHIWDEPEATFMRPGTRGVDIHDAVHALSSETVITKDHPNAFLGTDSRWSSASSPLTSWSFSA